MKKVSVIVPTYNEEKYLESTLVSLKNQTLSRSDYEIIVCDNNSSDGTVEVARNYADKIMSFDRRVSIASLRNAGAKKSDSDLLLFIDADVVVGKDFLEKLAGVDADYGVPYVRIGDGSMRLINMINDTFFMLSGGFGVTIGCCMFFKKSSFNRINGFDSDLYYNEDIDIVKRAKLSGLNFKLLDSVAVHNDRRFKKQGYIKSLPYAVKRFFEYALNMKRKYHYEEVR